MMYDVLLKSTTGWELPQCAYSRQSGTGCHKAEEDGSYMQALVASDDAWLHPVSLFPLFLKVRRGKWLHGEVEIAYVVISSDAYTTLSLLETTLISHSHVPKFVDQKILAYA
jgi:hypothetical protein